MTHFGIICLSATGHLNTMFPLGRALQQRGNRVTIFSGSSAQSKTLEAGFNFRDISAPSSPAGGGVTQKLSPPPADADKLTGLALLRYTLKGFARKIETSLQYTPAAVRQLGIEALLVDLKEL